MFSVSSATIMDLQRSNISNNLAVSSGAYVYHYLCICCCGHMQEPGLFQDPFVSGPICSRWHTYTAPILVSHLTGCIRFFVLQAQVFHQHLRDCCSRCWCTSPPVPAMADCGAVYIEEQVGIEGVQELNSGLGSSSLCRRVGHR